MTRPLHKFVGDVRNPGRHEIRDHVLCFMHGMDNPRDTIDVTTVSKDVTCEDCIRLDSVWGHIKEDGEYIHLLIEWRTNGTTIGARHRVDKQDILAGYDNINDALDWMIRNLDKMEEDFK